MSTQLIPFDINKQAEAAAPLTSNLATLQLAAKNLAVVDDTTCQQAVDLRTAAATAEKRINDYWKDLASLAHNIHRSITGKRDEMARPYTVLKDLMSGRIEKYLAQRRLAEREAAAALEKEAQRMQATLVQRAEDAVAAGDPKVARELLAQAQMSGAMVIPDVRPKLDGARVIEKWVGSVTDLSLVIKAVAEGKVALMHDVKGEEMPLLIVNEKVLKALADRMGPRLDIPGITVDQKTTVGAQRL